MNVFNGCQIALDLGTKVPFKKKQQLRKTITDNGGIVSFIITKKCSHLVVDDRENVSDTYKARTALKYGVPVVSLTFIDDCLKAEKVLEADDYIAVGKTKAEEFGSGKIVATKTQSDKPPKRKVVQLQTVRAWQWGDNKAPYYNEETYQVAKSAVLVKKSKWKNLMVTKFCVLEIHVAPPDATPATDKTRCRVFTHSGEISDKLLSAMIQDDLGKKEVRFSGTPDEALDLYGQLYKYWTTSPNNYTKTRQFLSPRIGSPKFKQMLCDYGMEQGSVSEEVCGLLEHIWQEAVGEVDNTLSVPLHDIKADQIEKAEAALVELKQALTKEDKSTVKRLSDEFFSHLPHKPSHQQPVNSKGAIANKHDLCQLLKDMVSVNEATSWAVRSSVEAKYRALRCHIAPLSNNTAEYKEVMSLLETSTSRSKKVSVVNVYALHRGVEEAVFNGNLGNKRLLVHASGVKNFVGILSRGLLKPKVVVDDFGGKRTDAGMLGNGIYFADNYSTWVKYSQTSNTKGTRMLLINEVSLGKCADCYKFDTELTAPPSGYNSAHGVQMTKGIQSDFQDDEYVIYDTSQQRQRYLVEFSLPDDKVRTVVSQSQQEKEPTSTELSSDVIEIGLDDVMDVVDPQSTVTAGLVSSSDASIPLASVDVRAKLVDLAAQVVVLQAYVNENNEPIEAKYVFPLGEMAVVCGFEAFINGKHVVGEVKEKQTAHHEYKEALAAGHGAYLMDQHEDLPEDWQGQILIGQSTAVQLIQGTSTHRTGYLGNVINPSFNPQLTKFLAMMNAPYFSMYCDVFTVSVGNIPPKASVLIKITYVAELQVDGEKICFSVPSSIAPWSKQKAFDDVTQTELTTVNVAKEIQNEVTIQVAIEMPFDIRSITCPTHRIRLKQTATKASVQMAKNQSLNEGFQLWIHLAQIHVPRMWVERYPGTDSEACMLTFYPEFDAVSRPDFEVVFLLDLSNSMDGPCLVHAKKLLLLLLHHLPPKCPFNIVVFGTVFDELFPASQPKTKLNEKAAHRFIQETRATMGNTEVLRPLHAYFLLGGGATTHNVFLISDGHINAEELTLVAVRDNAPQTRLFTFAVGSTANRHVLRRLAMAGAGAYEAFDSATKYKWEEQVTRQLSKAAQPSLSSVSVSWQQFDTDASPLQAPSHVTALFSGSRQVIYGLVSNCTQAELKAVINNQEIITMVSTSELNITSGTILHQLTARAAIRDWEEGILADSRTDHEITKKNRKNLILQLSTKYSIVTQFTSFVAVEKREEGETFWGSRGPSIAELVQRESVDALEYVAWDDDTKTPVIQVGGGGFSSDGGGMFEKAFTGELTAVNQPTERDLPMHGPSSDEEDLFDVSDEDCVYTIVCRDSGAFTGELTAVNQPTERDSPMFGPSSDKEDFYEDCVYTDMFPGFEEGEFSDEEYENIHTSDESGRPPLPPLPRMEEQDHLIEFSSSEDYCIPEEISVMLGAKSVGLPGSPQIQKPVIPDKSSDIDICDVMPKPSPLLKKKKKAIGMTDTEYTEMMDPSGAHSPQLTRKEPSPPPLVFAAAAPLQQLRPPRPPLTSLVKQLAAPPPPPPLEQEPSSMLRVFSLKSKLRSTYATRTPAREPALPQSHVIQDQPIQVKRAFRPTIDDLICDSVTKSKAKEVIVPVLPEQQFKRRYRVRGQEYDGGMAEEAEKSKVTQHQGRDVFSRAAGRPTGESGKGGKSAGLGRVVCRNLVPQDAYEESTVCYGMTRGTKAAPDAVTLGASKYMPLARPCRTFTRRQQHPWQQQQRQERKEAVICSDVSSLDPDQDSETEKADTKIQTELDVDGEYESTSVSETVSSVSSIDLIELDGMADITKDRMQSVARLQASEGYWEFSDELEVLTLMHGDRLKAFLLEAGLRSLGETLMTEVMRLACTLKLLLWMSPKYIWKDMEERPVDLSERLQHVKDNIIDAVTMNGADFCKYPGSGKELLNALEYCKCILEEHPLVFSQLELGHTWKVIMVKMFVNLS